MSLRMTRAELAAFATKSAMVTRSATRATLVVTVKLAIAIASAIGPRDVHFYGGLLVAGAGGWRLSPAWTLIVIGAVLTLVGLRGTPRVGVQQLQSATSPQSAERPR